MTLPILALVVILGQSGAQAGAPARDAATAPTFGTASISGMVVDDESPAKPVRRVLVTLTGSGLRPNRGAVTDDAGRFTIVNLPAGTFTLTVADPSFITSAYGAKRAGRPGTAIVVHAGEAIANLSVKIWRGAVVSGLLRDENGAAIPGVPVTAIAAHDVATGLLTLTNNGSVTNDRGEFRIFGLSPGTYVVAAKPAAGGGGPLTAMSEADVDAAFEAIRTRSTAPTRGAVSTGASDAQPLHPFDFAPVYYPGTSLLSDARPITLAAGQEIDGLDLPLVRVQTATVSGVISKPDGAPAAGAAVQLNAPESATFSSGLGLHLEVTADRTGAFVIPQVTPGDYEIVVRAPTTPPAPPATGGGFVSPRPQGPQLWARTTVTVAGADLPGLQITAMPGFTLSGRLTPDVVPDGSVPPDPAGWHIQLVTPEARNAKPGAVHSLWTSRGANVKADGTFDFENIAPGQYSFVVEGGGATNEGWMATSAVLGGRDLLDQDCALSAADVVEPVAITVSRQHTSLSGQLETKTGAPATDVFVIAFSGNRALWGSHSRRVQAVRPDASGHYTITGLPPGNYRLAAVTDIDPNEWDDAEFLGSLLTGSIPIAVNAGDTVAPTLRIGG